MNEECCYDCIHLMEWEEDGEMHQDCGYGITSAMGASDADKKRHMDFVVHHESTKWAFPNLPPVCPVFVNMEHWAKDEPPEDESRLTVRVVEKSLNASIKFTKDAWPSTESEEWEESERRKLVEIIANAVRGEEPRGKVTYGYIADMGEINA